MREIIFRGKRIDNGEWVYGYYTKARYYLNEKEMHVIFAPDGEAFPRCEFSDYEEVDPETVCQFTGLYDKNGRKIFEGDIVKRYYQSDVRFNIGVINWDSRNAWWACQLNTMNPCFSLYDEKQVEIIGNIYDNPELLEGRDEIL